MEPVKIPESCKPTSEVLYGYSGGMALYVANWESVLMLYEHTNVPAMVYKIIAINKSLN